MYKVEIITTIGSFITTIPEEVLELCKIDGGLIDIVKAIDWVDRQIAANAPLELDGDYSLLRLKSIAHLVALRAFSVDDVQPLGRTAEGDDGDESYTIWTTPIGRVVGWQIGVNYMGTICYAGILITRDNDGRSYFMLHTINDKPAHTKLNEAKHVEFLKEWLAQSGGEKGECIYVLPHGPIEDFEEAQAYLKDYVIENKPAYKPAEKTGKAWNGYTDDRGKK